MSDEKAKPILDQITDLFLEKLTASELYNKAIIAKLREAASKGKLSSHKALIEAITTTGK